MRDSTTPTRADRIARCTATASSINPAVPHNARRAAATNSPRHVRRRTAASSVRTAESAIGQPHVGGRCPQCRRQRGPNARSRYDRELHTPQRTAQREPDQRQRGAPSQQQELGQRDLQ